MTREEIVEQLQPLARKAFADPNLILADQLNAAEVPNWTSLTFTQLLSDIESHFSFKYKMMEILKLQNMGCIIESIVKHTCQE